MDVGSRLDTMQLTGYPRRMSERFDSATKDRQTNPTLAATVTPLASIFGSGFLIIVPILAGSVGPWSVLAMAGVCMLAYLVGEVIRFNIRYAEPVLDQSPSEWTLSFERASDLALVLAYVISVCLYLHILSAFVLGGAGLDTGINEDLLTTTIIVVITLIGVVRGLGMLEALESWSLYATFLIIALLLAGFAVHDWNAWQSPKGIIWPDMPQHTAWNILTVVAGTLIVVQGFETPRYLGEEFDAHTRVRASRYSQMISTAVYLAFVALAMPVVHTLAGNFGDNSLIKLATAMTPLLLLPVVAAAALSQFSAAVADTLAATGNMEEVTHRHIKERAGYIIIGAGAVALTWSADTFEIVAFASRAFAFYYLLQCLVAMSVSRGLWQRAGFLLVAGLLGFVAVFAVPAG